MTFLGEEKGDRVNVTRAKELAPRSHHRRDRLPLLPLHVYRCSEVRQPETPPNNFSPTSSRSTAASLDHL